MLHCLTHDLVKDLLKNSVFLKTSGTVETDGGMMGNPVGNLEAQKPSIGKVESYFLFQLPFGADSIEITDEKHLDEEYRVYGRSPLSLAVQVFDDVMDEGKVDMVSNFAKQVVLGYEVLQTDDLELRSGFLMGSEH